MGPCFLLVKALQDLILIINENFYYFLKQMVTSHRCTTLAFDVFCIINAYLNACIKASATEDLSNPGGEIPASFQFIIYDLEHGVYLDRPLSPSLWKLLLA